MLSSDQTMVEISHFLNNRICIANKVLNKELHPLILKLTSAVQSTYQLEWKIKGVKQKIYKKEITSSDPFYVGPYKCQGSILWDCNNTDKVGCFIRIMKGEFDYKLKWPFIYRFKFVIFNQNRNEFDYIWSSE